MKWKIRFKGCCYLTSNVITQNSVSVKNTKQKFLTYHNVLLKHFVVCYKLVLKI